MLINGEKWACEACVRGHRVSNCQHQDRPLQQIQKKGRPISQCQHCRSERKSRGAHVKCDCGEKTTKCRHLTASGHRESCCCNHGARCTCSQKKESPSLDTVPEAPSEGSSTKGSGTSKVPRSADGLTSGASLRRRRANTTASDGKAPLTFDGNGHHKPTHKGAKSSAKAAPYTLNRVQSMHAVTGLSLLDTAVGSRRSRPAAHSRTSSTSTIASSQSRTVRGADSTASSPSESPLLTASSPMFGSLALPRRGGAPTLSPVDFSHMDFPTTTTTLTDGLYDLNTAHHMSQAQRVASFDLFSGLSDDQPLFSAGLASGEDWSSYSGLRRDDMSSSWTSGAECASPVFGSLGAGLKLGGGGGFDGLSQTLGGGGGRQLGGLQPGPGLTPSGTSPDASDAGDLDSSTTASSLPALSAASSSLRLSSVAGSYAGLSGLATSAGGGPGGLMEYDEFLAAARATSGGGGKFGVSGAVASAGRLDEVYGSSAHMGSYPFGDEDSTLWIGSYGPELGGSGGGVAFSESPEPGARYGEW